MIYEHANYRSFLKGVLAQRTSQNRAYSLRAFAKQLGVHHSTLIQVFQGKKSFSFQRALEIATKLGLKGNEHEYFCALVQYEATENPEHKEKMLARLSSLNNGAPAFDLTVDHFKSISDWYCLPILQMTTLKNFNFTPKNIARRLGITTPEVEVAIERLERLELIEKNEKGQYQKTVNRLLTQSKVPNEALRRFHQQMLEKASGSLEVHKPEERVIGSETFAFDQAAMTEVRRLTDEYMTRVALLASQGKKRDQLYHLTTVFFNLTKEEA